MPVHRYLSVRGRSPCPPNDIANATLSLIDGRAAATIVRPPPKLIPIMPMRPSSPRYSAPRSIQVAASSIMSVVRGVIW